jgi:HEAT repeat protein
MKSAISFVVLVALVVGCGGPKTPKMPKPPAPPPAAPKRVERPIDPRLRSAAEAELAAAFQSSDAFLGANAVESTQKTLGIEGKDRILAALNDRRVPVQFAGAVAAGTLRLEEAHGRLRQLATESRDGRVRAGSIFALHRLGDHQFSRELEKLATDQDPRVRGNTVLVLGLLGEPSAMNILSTMRELNPAVQLQILEAKYRLGDKDAKEQLVAGTVSSAPDDQIISLLALAGTRDPSVAPVLRSKLTSDYPEVSLAAARALGMIGSDDGMGVALKFVDNRDKLDPRENPNNEKVMDPGARRRAMAALALGEIGRTDAQPQLEKLLRDPDANVRLAAATAILQLRPAFDPNR